MARLNWKSHRLDADYTEDAVGFALESFLTALTFPLLPFSIEPFSRKKERALGADARLHSKIAGFKPFYMQFKRPSAYPDYSTASIIRDRKGLDLDVVPHALFFSLREKRPKHREFQHNVLLRLRDRLLSKGLGDAAYVCPLFLDRAAYRLDLHLSALWRWFWHGEPWDFSEVLLKDGGKEIRFDRIPVLAEHISIPPHTEVTTAKHKYSFTEAGTELCFHSPESLTDGSMDLGLFLRKLSVGVLEGANLIGLERANAELRELATAVVENEAADEQPFLGSDDPIANWMSWGHWLQDTYGISQFAFFKWQKL